MACRQARGCVCFGVQRLMTFRGHNADGAMIMEEERLNVVMTICLFSTDSRLSYYQMQKNGATGGKKAARAFYFTYLA